MARLVGNPAEIFADIGKCDVDDRAPAAPSFVIVGFDRASAIVVASSPFVESDLEFADGERTLDGDRVSWHFLSELSPGVRIVGAHDKRAGGDHHDLGALAAITEDFAGLPFPATGGDGGEDEDCRNQEGNERRRG